ncbi:Noncompact myelin-associated protein [Lemmus lemmus]
MRTRRELEPKSPKPPVPPALDPNSNGSQQPANVTLNPADIQVETR